MIPSRGTITHQRQLKFGADLILLGRFEEQLARVQQRLAQWPYHSGQTTTLFISLYRPIFLLYHAGAQWTLLQYHLTGHQ